MEYPMSKPSKATKVAAKAAPKAAPKAAKAAAPRVVVLPATKAGHGGSKAPSLGVSVERGTRCRIDGVVVPERSAERNAEGVTTASAGATVSVEFVLPFPAIIVAGLGRTGHGTNFPNVHAAQPIRALSVETRAVCIATVTTDGPYKGRAVPVAVFPAKGGVECGTPTWRQGGAGDTTGRPVLVAAPLAALRVVGTDGEAL